jgi:hypothetical protein
MHGYEPRLSVFGYIHFIAADKYFIFFLIIKISRSAFFSKFLICFFKNLQTKHNPLILHGAVAFLLLFKHVHVRVDSPVSDGEKEKTFSK